MIQWNAEEQVATRLDVERGRLIDWGVMLGRGNPTGLGFSAGRFQDDLVYEFHAIRTRLWRTGEHLDGSRAVVF